MATETSISTLTPATTSPGNLSSLAFTMSSKSTGAASRLDGSVFANIVMGTSPGYKIWMGSKAAYTALGSYDSTTAYLIMP